MIQDRLVIFIYEHHGPSLFANLFQQIRKHQLHVFSFDWYIECFIILFHFKDKTLFYRLFICSVKFTHTKPDYRLRFKIPVIIQPSIFKQFFFPPEHAIIGGDSQAFSKSPGTGHEIELPPVFEHVQVFCFVDV